MRNPRIRWPSRQPQTEEYHLYERVLDVMAYEGEVHPGSANTLALTWAALMWFPILWLGALTRAYWRMRWQR